MQKCTGRPWRCSGRATRITRDAEDLHNAAFLKILENGNSDFGENRNVPNQRDTRGSFLCGRLVQPASGPVERGAPLAVQGIDRWPRQFQLDL